MSSQHRRKDDHVQSQLSCKGEGRENAVHAVLNRADSSTARKGNCSEAEVLIPTSLNAFGESALLQKHFQDDVRSLDLYAPAHFEAALGCLCVTEYIAFYPDIHDSDIIYDNGVMEDTINSRFWQIWTSQTQVAEKVGHVTIFEAHPYRALLLNTITRLFYDVDEEQTRDFLRRHYVDRKRLQLL